MAKGLGYDQVKISRCLFDHSPLSIQDWLSAEGVVPIDAKEIDDTSKYLPANLACSIPFLKAYLESPLAFEDFCKNTPYAYQICHHSNDVEYAKRILFRDSKKPTNGWVALKLNAKISIPLSRFLSRFSIRPNWITLLNVPFILAAPYCYAKPGYAWGVLGGLFFQLASVLDGCDGEVARTKLQVTEWGGWLDTFTDNSSYLLFFLAVGVFPSRIHDNPLYLYVMLAALSLLTVALLATYAGMRRMGSATHHAYREAFQKMACSSSLLRGVDRLNFLSRRENFALGIFLLCLANGRMALFWILCGCMVLFSFIVLLTFPKLFRIMGANTCDASSSSTHQLVPKKESEPFPKLST